MLQLLSIFLMYVGLTACLRLFVATISSSAFLSFGSKIFFVAFLPGVLFLSLLLFMMPDPGYGTLIFILLMIGSRVIILLADGYQYLQKINLGEADVEIVYVTDFLQEKMFSIPLNSIRSVKLDNADRLIDYPCRLQLSLRSGRSLTFYIIDQEQMRIQEEHVLEMVKRLEFSER
jgi:hypothetical protein